MKKCLSYFFCFLFFTSSVMGQTKWSLQACIEYAVKNNLSVSQAALQKRLAQLPVSLARASRWPSLSFSGNGGYRFGLSENPTTGTLQSSNFFSTGFSLSAGVGLFSWFSKKHTIAAAEADVQVAGMAEKKAENDVVLTVQAAYLQALLAKELAEAARFQVRQSSAVADITQKKILASVLSELDAAQIRVQLLADSNALIAAVETTEKALLQLKAVLALDAAIPFDVEEIKLTGDEHLLEPPEVLYRRSLQHLPELVQAKHTLKANEHRLQVARAGRLPSLSVYGSLGSNYVHIPSAQTFAYIPAQPTGANVLVNGVNYEVMAPAYQATGFGVTPLPRQLQKNFGQNTGLTLTVPLLGGKTLSTAVKREEINRLQLLLQKQKLEQDTKTAIYSAYTETTAAGKKAAISDRMFTESANLLAAAQKRYGLNLLSTQDLLSIQANWQKAKTALLLAQYDLAFKRKLLSFYNYAVNP